MGVCQGTQTKKATKPNLEIQIPNNNSSDQGKNSPNTQPKSACLEKQNPQSLKRQSLKTSQFQQYSASSDQAFKARKSTPLVDIKGLESDKVRSTKHKSTFKMNATVKKAPFSKFYSVQQGKKGSFSKIAGGNIIVQHNLTGKLHYADILDNSAQSQFYIDELLRCQISHPNITNVIEILEDKSQFIVIKECCQGQPVSFYEPQEKQLQIVKQIIEAIQYLHSKNLVHGGLWLGAFERTNNIVKLVDLKSIFIRHEPTNYDIEYVAPECTLEPTLYTQQRDIWAVGMMAHNILNGRFFKTGHFQDIQKEIEQMRIKKHIHLEQLNKEFLEKFLHISPDKRISLCEIIKDQFLPQVSENENQISEFQKIFDRNINLKTISVLQQCLLLLFINQFEEQKLKLQQFFLNLDQDHDNKITKKDCLNLMPNAEMQINSLFNLISVKDKMDFQEFLILAVNKQQLLTDENIETIFNLYSTGKKYILMTNLINIYKQREKEIEEEFEELEHPHLNFKNFESLIKQLL